MTTSGPHPGRLADEPHHDGSARYLDATDRRLGAAVRVRLRVPEACGSTRVQLRSTPDGEPAVTEAVVVAREPGVTWWEADLVLANPMTRYRWLLSGGPLGRGWVNGAGVFARDVTDDADFRISTAPATPTWLAGTVGYQIFIDRFADSGRARPVPDWAVPRAWHEPVDDTPGVRARHWYGGDLAGVEQHLDHLEQLGVTLIYLTPFFPAGSMHRYDATTFDHVDPALGGDDALASLASAAHRRGIRLIGDLTLNHTGAGHDWFRAASAADGSGPPVVERDFYHFDPEQPYGYVAWHGVPSLPKLDHRSGALRRRLYDGPDSVVARFVEEPFSLDGWRIDCANTTARHAAHDHNHEVARRTRATLDAGSRHDRWLVAEHCYDAGSDLDGDGWHGVMAYQWFTRPLWGWLKDPGPVTLMSSVELMDLDGIGMVETMRHLEANVPWAARQASMTMLDSHDTARLRTIVGGDRVRHVVAVAALCTMPGVPTLFAGVEAGCEGDSSDTARVPFPWARLAAVDDSDTGFRHDLQVLIALRRRHEALQTGSMRWVDSSPDSVTYVRESATEHVLVHLVRRPCDPRSFVAPEIGVDERLVTADGCSVEFGDADAVAVEAPADGAPPSITVAGVPGAYVVSVPRR